MSSHSVVAPSLQARSIGAPPEKRAHVVTFGELLLRLSPAGCLRLEQAHALDVSFGGGEANVAVSLARFGLSVGFVTRLPDNDLGHAGARYLRRLDVDTSHVVYGGGRQGIYFLEAGSAQRPSNVIYDREGSALATISAGEVDWASALGAADWFHVTGITPAVSEGAARAAVEAATAARAAKATVSVDLNYRAKLWRWAGRPAEVMRDLVNHADVIVGNEEDAERIFGIRAGDTEVRAGRIDVEAYDGVCRELARRFPRVRTIAFTIRGSVSASENTWSGVLWDGERLHQGPTYRIVPIVDRVGAGDAFAAALIYALIERPDDAPGVLAFAVAASCLKHTIVGDFNLVNAHEVRRLVAGDGSGRVVR